MNVCIFTGRLTATPELKTTASGKSVCNFTLAVDRRFKDSDGNPVVDFIDFVAWENSAEFLCKWFDKGLRVAVSGELQTRTWTDDSDVTRKVSEILVNKVEFADGKREANTSNDDSRLNDEGFIPFSDDSKLPFN